MDSSETPAEAELFRHSPLDEHLRAPSPFRDGYYGEMKLLVDPASRTRVALKELTFDHRRDALAMARVACSRWRVLHPALAPLLDFSLIRQAGLCAKLYVLRLFYDFHRVDLRHELDLRRQSQQHFPPGEITLAMYRLLDLLRVLQERGIAHGALCPQAVLVYSAPFALRLKLAPAEPQTAVAYFDLQKRRPRTRQGSCLSPAFYRALAEGKADYVCDPFVEDSFALGALLLEMGTLRSCAPCYREEGDFNHESLAELFALFAELYRHESMILVELVDFLLFRQMKQRRTFAQLLDMLPPLEEVEEFLRRTTPSSQTHRSQQALPFTRSLSLRDVDENFFAFVAEGRPSTHRPGGEERASQDRAALFRSSPPQTLARCPLEHRISFPPPLPLASPVPGLRADSRGA
mgnify:CR=1 FL=1